MGPNPSRNQRTHSFPSLLPRAGWRDVQAPRKDKLTNPTLCRRGLLPERIVLSNLIRGNEARVGRGSEASVLRVSTSRD